MPARPHEGFSPRLALARALASCLSLVAPVRAARYLAAHEALSSLAGYAAARRDGPNKRWLPLDGRADDLALRDSRLIRARARALVRDNPNMAGALRRIVGNVVYTGIRPQAQLPGKDGLRDKPSNDAVEAQWSAWADAVDMWELQKLCIRHCWQDGGAFLHFYPDENLLDNGLVPLGLELLDLDALNTGVNGPQPGGGIAYLGREYDRAGNVLAAHVWRDALFGGVENQGVMRDYSAGLVYSAGDSVRLTSENCLLVMERDRIGQTLPVSWLHACIMTMRDFDQYQSAERLAARLAAAFAVFLKHTDPVAGGNALDGSPLAGGETTDGKKLSVNAFISEGRIDELPPGTDIVIAENKRPGSNYEPYTRTSLRSGSAGIGTSYQTFSNDYADANYSSMRQAVLEERRGYRMQQVFLGRKMLAPCWQRFIRWRRLFGLGAETFVPVSWQYSGWSWVDPAKDAAAARDRVALGVACRRDICAEQGLDFDEVAENLASEQRLLQSLGLDGAGPENGEAAQAMALYRALAPIIARHAPDMEE